MSTAAIALTGYQTLPLTQLHESSTNPRRTFEPGKLVELAKSISTHGLIQPITVRPNSDGFEIVAGARRFRAAQIAELTEIPVRILELTDAQTLEIQIVENAQRADIHPYEEAAGYKRLLELPGYDVAALALKCGKSQSHVYGRLSLLQLSTDIAEAFQQERITASHASLLSRLNPEQQAQAYAECWRKGYGDTEPHLLPARVLSAWIQENLYLALADAPFDREDPTLNPAAGACITCPRRSGYNTALFADVVESQGDQCFDAACYKIKTTACIDHEIAARPNLVQIEEGWRSGSEHRPDAVRRGHYREIDTVAENPEAEPVAPCEAARPALIVYGRNLGTLLTVCTDNHCPVHDPRQASDRAANPSPVLAAPTEDETEEQTAARKVEYQQQQEAYRAEQERKEATRLEELERIEKEEEAAQERRAKQQKKRASVFERILENAPPTFSTTHLRVLLRALVNMDPYTFADDLAVELNGDDENDQRSGEEVLLTTIDGLADDKLTRFTLHLALAGHRAIPREDELDFLAEAEAVFAPKKSTAGPAKVASPKSAKSQPAPAPKRSKS